MQNEHQHGARQLFLTKKTVDDLDAFIQIERMVDRITKRIGRLMVMYDEFASELNCLPPDLERKIFALKSIYMRLLHNGNNTNESQ